jgi:hypothetical protein
MSSVALVRAPRSAVVALFALFLLLAHAHTAHAQAPYAPTSPWPYDDVPPSLSLAAAAAAADEPPRPPEPASAPFGTQGQFVLGGGTNVGVSSTQYDASAGTQVSLSFSPSLDYFVLKNFSIGLDVNVGYEDDKGYGTDSSLVEIKTTSVMGGPRFGLNIPFGNAVSWWLTGTLGIESVQTTTSLVSGTSISTSSSAGAPDTRREGPYVSLYLPLLVHPARHFFMGAGPSLFHEFAALQGGPNVGDQRTTVGGGFVVGGYWGGTPETTNAPAAESTTPARPLKRFGEKGEFVFTNELVGSAYSTSYAGTTSSVFQGQISLAGDYFLVDHFAIGLGGGGSWYGSTGTDANGDPVANSNSGFSFFVRTSVQIPVAGAISLYPHVALGIGGGNYKESSVSGQDAYSLTTVSLQGYLPLVVEVAPHFFAGFGPSAERDLSSNVSFVQGGQISNPGTTFGAGFVVGGWL